MVLVLYKKLLSNYARVENIKRCFKTMESCDLFKESFKQFKSKTRPLDLKDVIDLDTLDGTVNDKVQVFISEAVIPLDLLRDVGLSDTKKWKSYTVKDVPGLIFIRNPFTVIGQRYWIARSCRDFPKRPNKTNLQGEREFTDRDWWTISQRIDQKLIHKLRWTTLGYHHNWDTKVYSEDDKSPFPPDLATLTKTIATYIGQSEFKAEAAIVNYYHMDSTLSGHTDHSEVNLEAPLISISFGQSAVFLAGEKASGRKPQAMMTHSGDIVFMSRQSGLVRTAVPDIVPSEKHPWVGVAERTFSMNSENGEAEVDAYGNRLMEMCTNSYFWRWCNEYFLSQSMISINVSFGQSAIFLIGGKTKATKPQAILLKSGDVLIMSGESRLFYHGVPRLIHANDEPWAQNNEDETPEVIMLNQENGEEEQDLKRCKMVFYYDNVIYWPSFSNYVEKFRININVRQVLCEGQTSL